MDHVKQWRQHVTGPCDTCDSADLTHMTHIGSAISCHHCATWAAKCDLPHTVACTSLCENSTHRLWGKKERTHVQPPYGWHSVAAEALGIAASGSSCRLAGPHRDPPHLPLSATSGVQQAIKYISHVALQISPEQGQFMALLVKLMGVNSAIEV